MALFIGIALALVVFLFARLSGFDRDRAFYPTVTIVVAHYYVLFAAMGGQGLGPEMLVMALFVAAAVAGFKTSLWLVAAALAGHGAFDLVHARLIDNPGVPAFWPMFCMSYDVMAAACLSWLLIRRPAGMKVLDA
jgi:hypothetical protein